MVTKVKQFGVRELRQSASQILDEVKNGATVEITERGKAIARLSPVEEKIDKELLKQEMITAGLLIAPSSPLTVLSKKYKPIKLPEGVSASDLLIKLRRAERY